MIQEIGRWLLTFTIHYAEVRCLEYVVRLNYLLIAAATIVQAKPILCMIPAHWRLQLLVKHIMILRFTKLHRTQLLLVPRTTAQLALLIAILRASHSALDFVVGSRVVELVWALKFVVLLGGQGLLQLVLVKCFLLHGQKTLVVWLGVVAFGSNGTDLIDMPFIR